MPLIIHVLPLADQAAEQELTRLVQEIEALQASAALWRGGEAPTEQKPAELVLSLLPSDGNESGPNLELNSQEPGQPTGWSLGLAPDKEPIQGQGLADLAKILVEQARKTPQRRRVRILADGKKLPAKGFVQDIVANTVLGLTATLKGVEGAKRLEIIIE